MSVFARLTQPFGRHKRAFGGAAPTPAPRRV
jgi:hypothetical protein